MGARPGPREESRWRWWRDRLYCHRRAQIRCVRPIQSRILEMLVLCHRSHDSKSSHRWVDYHPKLFSMLYVINHLPNAQHTMTTARVMRTMSGIQSLKVVGGGLGFMALLSLAYAYRGDAGPRHLYIPIRFACAKATTKNHAHHAQHAVTALHMISRMSGNRSLKVGGGAL
jgi:hypothetical protein